MKTVSVWLLVFSALSLSLLHPGGAEVPIPLQLVPQGTESVNGSDVNMGCTIQPMVVSGVTFCGGFGYLVDGNSPAIDTSTSNWASQLVTVRKKDANDDIAFTHIVMTFGFDIAVSLTTIELDLFLCPEWNIGASHITVFADRKSNLVFSRHTRSIDFLVNHTPSQTQLSCDSLSTIIIPLQEHAQGSSYSTWHIIVSFTPQPDIEWVYVGEVRFLADPDPIQDTLPSADILTTPQLQSTSVPRNRENDCTCSECSSSAVAAVSAVSLLLIVILTTVVLTQCLLMVRMRKSKDAMHRNETYAEVMTPSTMHADVPVSPNEAYTLQKMTNSSEEAVYELIN